MAKTIIGETKKEGKKKAKRHIIHKNQKERDNWSLSWSEAISPIAFLMPTICKSWDLIIMKSLEQTSLTNPISLYSKG